MKHETLCNCKLKRRLRQQQLQKPFTQAIGLKCLPKLMFFIKSHTNSNFESGDWRSTHESFKKPHRCHFLRNRLLKVIYLTAHQRIHSGEKQ